MQQRKEPGKLIPLPGKSSSLWVLFISDIIIENCWGNPEIYNREIRENREKIEKGLRINGEKRDIIPFRGYT